MEILRVLEQGEPASEQRLRYTSEYGPCSVCYSDEEPDEALTQEGLLEWIRPAAPPGAGDDFFVAVDASGQAIAEACRADALSPRSRERLTCKRCKAAAPKFFMLHDELWSKCGARTDVLCFSCAEARLGRPFTAGDFTSAPVNGWVHDAFGADLYPDPARIMPEARLREKHFRMEIIRIPAVARHSGFLVMETAVPWFCIHCGAERGEPRESFDFDGLHPLAVTKWQNPCGHTETYEAVRAWIKTCPQG